MPKTRKGVVRRIWDGEAYLGWWFGVNIRMGLILYCLKHYSGLDLRYFYAI